MTDTRLQIEAAAFVKLNKVDLSEFAGKADPYLFETVRRLNEACELIERLTRSPVSDGGVND